MPVLTFLYSIIVLSSVSYLISHSRQKLTKLCPGKAVNIHFIGNVSGCFLYVDQAAYFDTAEAHCNALDGHLVTIHNTLENRLILDYANQFDKFYHGFWIGVHRLSKDTPWTYVDTGNNVSTFQWAIEQPFVGSNGTLCVSLNFEASWFSTYCDIMRYYVCQLPFNVISDLPSLEESTSPATKTSKNL